MASQNSAQQLQSQSQPQQQQLLQHYGVTEPLSTSGPTEADISTNQDLHKVLFFVKLRSLSHEHANIYPKKILVVYLCIYPPIYPKFSLLQIIAVYFLRNSFLCYLFQFLASAGLYESQEEAVLREEVLGRLDQVRQILDFEI